MAVSPIRRANLAALLMLGCSVLAVPAQAGWFDSDSKPAAKTPAAKTDAKNAAGQLGTTLDDSINQAQMLRLAGSYPEAIKHLSQVMMVAGDDPRVISEYGKTLAAMGRASDAVNFLTRAQQLQPNDWTVYSALGVAYDQIGDQKSAQLNYEQALKLSPEEPSVLSNYALSRMLAKDPEMAHKLAARAESAGGGSSALIGRNIAMIRSLAPEATAPVQQVANATVPAPVAASAAARAPAPIAVASNVQPQVASNTSAQGDNRVVMQKVPVDPLAGPVHTAAKPSSAAVVATNAPRPLQAKTALSPGEAPVTPALVKAAEVKPAPVKAAEPAPVATAKLTPAAPVKAAEVKPAPVKPAETAPVVIAAKVTPPAPLKAVAIKAVPVQFSQSAPLTAAKMALVPIKIVEPTAKMTPPVKAAEVKAVKPADVAPVATAKAMPPAAVKAADAKPAPVKPAEPTAVAAAKVTPPALVKAADAKPAPVKLAEPTAVAAKVTPAAPVKAAEVKPTSNALVPVKTAETKPVPVKAAEAKPATAKPAEPVAVAAAKVTSPAPVKVGESAPAVTVKMTPPPPVKTAEAKPAASALVSVKTAEAKPVPVKAVVKTKDTIPGLRLSANAY